MSRYSQVYDARLHDAPCIAGNQFTRTQEDDALLPLRKSTLSFARRGKTSLRTKDGKLWLRYQFDVFLRACKVVMSDSSHYQGLSEPIMVGPLRPLSKPY